MYRRLSTMSVNNLLEVITRQWSWWVGLDFSARVRFGRSRSSKVIDFGTNRKRV